MAETPIGRDNHKCFGCQKQIADHEPHIHVGLDEWSGTQGMDGFGLDDILTFPFCETCTEKGGHWSLEAHTIPDESERTP